MLRRPVRNPVFAAWKCNVRRTSLFPRPSFLILKVTRPYLFVFALRGVTPRANTRTTAPRAARPLALTVTVTRRPFVTFTSFVASLSRVSAAVPTRAAWPA